MTCPINCGVTFFVMFNIYNCNVSDFNVQLYVEVTRTADKLFEIRMQLQLFFDIPA